MYHHVLNHLLLPLFLCGTPSRYQRLARESSKRQYWSTQRMQQWQLERSNEIIATAKGNVPYYRERFHQFSEPLRNLRSLCDLPQLTKDDVAANFPDGIVSETADRSQIRWHGTGGTTHHIMVADDFVKRDYVRAAHHLTYCEDCSYQFGRPAVFIPPNACSVLCATDGRRDSSVLRHFLKMLARGKLRDAEARSDLRGLIMNNWIECRTVLEPFGPDGTHLPKKRLSQYVERLRELKPYLLKALPEYLMGIARYIDETDDRPHHIPVVKPAGALMTPAMKKRVENSFRSRVIEDYGCSDVGPLGFECRNGGIHLLTDHFYFEFDHRGRPAEDGELATLLLTDLHNTAMPMIRYKLGDLVRVDRTPCPCGRQTPRIVVAGRTDEVIVGKSGNIITPRMACEFFYKRPKIQSFQLIERSDRQFDLKCVLDKGASVPDELPADFRTQFADDRTLAIKVVDSIRPETSGKFRHIKSRSSDRFSQAGDQR